MIDKSLRHPKRLLLAPAAERLAHTHPTRITLIALAAGLGSALLAFLGAYPGALALWLLNRVLDGLDGEIARRHDRQSDLGGYLDILADFLVYALLPIALAAGRPDEVSWLALALMLAVFYLNAGSWMMLSAILEKRGHGAAERGESTTVNMPGGLIEGAETVLLYTLFLLFPHALSLLFAVTAALVLFTVLQRLQWALRTLPQMQSQMRPQMQSQMRPQEDEPRHA